MSVLLYQPRAEARALLAEKTRDEFRRLARPSGLAIGHDRTLELADRWLEGAYQLELAGNHKRAAYLLGIVGRL